MSAGVTRLAITLAETGEGCEWWVEKDGAVKAKGEARAATVALAQARAELAWIFAGGAPPVGPANTLTQSEIEVLCGDREAFLSMAHRAHDRALRLVEAGDALALVLRWCLGERGEVERQLAPTPIERARFALERWRVER